MTPSLSKLFQCPREVGAVQFVISQAGYKMVQLSNPAPMTKSRSCCLLRQYVAPKIFSLSKGLKVELSSAHVTVERTQVLIPAEGEAVRMFWIC
jgi:hypothetical protein